MSNTAGRIFTVATAEECLAAADEIKVAKVERVGNSIDEYRPSQLCSAIAQAAHSVSISATATSRGRY